MKEAEIAPGVSRFVEDTGLLLEEAGFTRTGGRLVGWLLACDPPEQSAQDLSEALEASAGGISTTLRALQRGGFVERTARSGDRRAYYRVSPTAWEAMEGDQLRFVTSFRALLDDCLTADDAPVDLARLHRARQFFAFLEREIPQLWERFIQEEGASSP
ncbi:GbsR/MarR family transcriptional regulator [Paraoerskovia marina]|uniref:GbsR/MarR family transcriptional regulator n=1 Tax=Paraoerskovia marina TaxID=545619 RepID=UPI000693583C|nr:MarR family transcriptional regulator [Paraoerskovia marina]